MKTESKDNLVPQNPIILRCHRLMEAFAKSDDERHFYLDKLEGFIVFVDLDKPQEELDGVEKELRDHSDRYVAIPRMTLYEIKKLMEGFVNEKVYDIDTKEKLLDIIQSKNARDNFLEFVYDHHTELEKWQQYYQEKFRIRMIEWLRNYSFDFVFEEDSELTKSMVEKVKINMFTPKTSKDILQARKILATKAATYYSNEALNPRPKRGRPPKQTVKVETEPQFSQDIYVAVPKPMKTLLFTPDYHSSSVLFTFSDKFASEADLLAHRKQQLQDGGEISSLTEKLQAIRTISSTWTPEAEIETPPMASFEEDMPIREKKKLPAIKGEQKEKAPVSTKSSPKKASKPTQLQPKKKEEKTSLRKLPAKTHLRPLVRKLRKK